MERKKCAKEGRINKKRNKYTVCDKERGRNKMGKGRLKLKQR
jgi:hypothetical protein